jgi:hypothetical protein
MSMRVVVTSFMIYFIIAQPTSHLQHVRQRPSHLRCAAGQQQDLLGHACHVKPLLTAKPRVQKGNKYVSTSHLECDASQQTHLLQHSCVDHINADTL